MITLKILNISKKRKTILSKRYKSNASILKALNARVYEYGWTHTKTSYLKALRHEVDSIIDDVCLEVVGGSR